MHYVLKSYAFQELLVIVVCYWCLTTGALVYIFLNINCETPIINKNKKSHVCVIAFIYLFVFLNLSVAPLLILFLAVVVNLLVILRVKVACHMTCFTSPLLVIYCSLFVLLY